MINWLYNEWFNISASDAYVNWPCGPIEAIFTEPGMFSTAPER